MKKFINILFILLLVLTSFVFLYPKNVNAQTTQKDIWEAFSYKFHGGNLKYDLPKLKERYLRMPFSYGHYILSRFVIEGKAGCINLEEKSPLTEENLKCMAEILGVDYESKMRFRPVPRKIFNEVFSVNSPGEVGAPKISDLFIVKGFLTKQTIVESKTDSSKIQDLPFDQKRKPQNKDLIAEIDTNYGKFRILLFPESGTMMTNFVELARSGFYNGLTFHRITDLLIQGGDPTETGYGGYSYLGRSKDLKAYYNTKISNIKGAVSFLTMPGDTVGSQFFINTKDNLFFDADKKPTSYKFAVFGQVYDGMSTLDSISKFPVDSKNKPLEPVTIKSISILEYKVTMGPVEQINLEKYVPETEKVEQRTEPYVNIKGVYEQEFKFDRELTKLLKFDIEAVEDINLQGVGFIIRRSSGRISGSEDAQDWYYGNKLQIIDKDTGTVVKQKELPRTSTRNAMSFSFSDEPISLTKGHNYTVNLFIDMKNYYAPLTFSVDMESISFTKKDSSFIDSKYINKENKTFKIDIVE